MAGKQKVKKSPPKQSLEVDAGVGPFTQALLNSMHRQPKLLTPEQRAVNESNKLQQTRWSAALGLMQSGASQFDTAEKALAQVDRLIELTPMQKPIESTQGDLSLGGLAAPESDQA